jgi:hypothetical protein
METKYYVTIPYSLKDQAKSRNAQYDIEKKSWYVIKESAAELFELRKIDVNFELKDLAKENGCIWNKEKKCWMTCKFNVDYIKQIMASESINTLVIKKKELMKHPEIKLLHQIDKMENNLRESNKMTFPRW